MSEPVTAEELTHLLSNQRRELLRDFADFTEKILAKRTPYLTVTEFAKKTGYSNRSINSFIHKGIIDAKQPTNKKNGKWLIPAKELAQFLSKN